MAADVGKAVEGVDSDTLYTQGQRVCTGPEGVHTQFRPQWLGVDNDEGEGGPETEDGKQTDEG